LSWLEKTTVHDTQGVTSDVTADQTASSVQLQHALDGPKGGTVGTTGTEVNRPGRNNVDGFLSFSIVIGVPGLIGYVQNIDEGINHKVCALLIIRI